MNEVILDTVRNVKKSEQISLLTTLLQYGIDILGLLNFFLIITYLDF